LLKRFGLRRTLLLNSDLGDDLRCVLSEEILRLSREPRGAWVYRLPRS